MSKITDFFTKAAKSFSSVNATDTSRGWFPLIREPFTGAWQRNLECSQEDMISYPPVFACITLIASDISKLPLSLVKRTEDGTWEEYENSAYSPVLRRPNHYQNRIQFYESWNLSILSRGNTYILKGRDERGVVNALYILDPDKVVPMVTDDGEVWYSLSPERFADLPETVLVPAKEIIHDRINCLYHPLVGISPLYAAALPIIQGRNIQKNSANFFANSSRPGGILTVEGAVDEDDLRALKQDWSNNYSGSNAGQIAVLADGMKYDSFQVATASDSQVIEQLGWSAEVVCSVFHVPSFMIGVGQTPNYNSVEKLNQQYYAQALQHRIESMELCLDEGLEMKKDIGTLFDVDSLLRMDAKTTIEVQKEAVGAGIKTINEGRKAINLKKVNGGDTTYLQQQMYSLEALQKRDAQDNPFGSSSNSQTQNDNNEDEEEILEDEEMEQRYLNTIRTKAVERFAYVK